MTIILNLKDNIKFNYVHILSKRFKKKKHVERKYLMVTDGNVEIENKKLVCIFNVRFCS